jgi:hypothetical protein
MNPFLAALPITAFEVGPRLAHGTDNLGQGLPEDPGSEDVQRKAAQATGAATPRSWGVPLGRKYSGLGDPLRSHAARRKIASGERKSAREGLGRQSKPKLQDR